jgi:methyl-accepting chemotaxis protein
MMSLILEQQNALRGYVLMGDDRRSPGLPDNAAGDFDKALDAFEAKTTQARPEGPRPAPARRHGRLAARHRRTDPGGDEGPVAGRAQAGPLIGKKSLDEMRACRTNCRAPPPNA